MSGKKAKADRRRLREEVAEALAGTAYWHGGPDGLKVGTILLPTTQLHQLSADARIAHPWFDDLDHGHVCATTDKVLAHDFAARWNLAMQAAFLQALSPDGSLPARNPWREVPRTEGGTVYRVQPLGPISRDPDYPEGISFRMPRARIIAVEEPLGYVLPAPGAVFVAATSFAFGLVVVVSSISAAGLRAEVTPPDMMGRVSSAHRFVSLGAMPVGALLAGLLAGPLPYGVVLLLSPCLITVAATVFLISPLRAHRNLPEEWKHREQETQTSAVPSA